MRHTCIKIKRKIKNYNFLVKLCLTKMKLYLLRVCYIDKSVLVKQYTTLSMGLLV